MESEKSSIKKVLVYIVIITIIILGGLFKVSNDMTKDVEEQKYEKLKKEMTSKLSQLLNEKFSIGQTVSISLAYNKDIKNALMKNDRDIAIEAIDGLSKAYAEYTNLKNVKIHIHTKDVKSFVRNWDTNKYGDRLDTFRYTINSVKETKKPIVAIEIGKAGLSIRGISPVLSNDMYIGSIEFMQGFNSVVKDMKTDDISLMVLMMEFDDIDSPERKVKKLTISQKEYDKKFKDILTDISFERLRKESYVLYKDYFVVCIPVIGYDSRQVGVYVMGQRLDKVHQEISGAKDLIDTSILLIISAFITFGLVFYIARSK
jgi:methyl-accepting chemotaxis protein